MPAPERPSPTVTSHVIIGQPNGLVAERSGEHGHASGTRRHARLPNLRLTGSAVAVVGGCLVRRLSRSARPTAAKDAVAVRLGGLTLLLETLASGVPSTARGSRTLSGPETRKANLVPACDPDQGASTVPTRSASGLSCGIWFSYAVATQ